MGRFFGRRPARARIEGPGIAVRPAPASPAITVRLDTIGTTAASVARLRDAASAVTAGIGRVSRPDSFAETEVYRLTAVVRPAGVFLPGTYQVTYHRIGRHGRRGTPAPIPLTTHATTLDDLIAAIADDAEQHLDGATPDVLVDMRVMGGTIRTNGVPAGTFTLHAVPDPRQETTTP
jgi:hypothetical protein